MSAVETRGSGSDPASDGGGEGVEALPPPGLRTLAAALPKFFIALAGSLAIVAIAILAFGANPLEAAKIIIDTSLGTSFGIGRTITIAGILTLTGLAAALPFRAGFWNVGGEGQLFAGAIGATIVALSIGASLGSFIAVVAVLLGALIGGAIWGSIAGGLKAAFNINEVIVSLMLSFIAISAADYVIRAGWPEGIATQTEEFPENTLLPMIWEVGQVSIGPLVAVLVVLAAWFLMSYTPLGFKIRAVGLNPKTAVLNGISSGRIAVQTFVIGGAMAGLGGGIAVLGQGALVANFSPLYGFIGIAVALLARLNPLVIIPSALLFALLQVGSSGLFVGVGLDPAVGDLLVAAFIISLLLFGLIRLPSEKAGL